MLTLASRQLCFFSLPLSQSSLFLDVGRTILSPDGSEVPQLNVLKQKWILGVFWFSWLPIHKHSENKTQNSNASKSLPLIFQALESPKPGLYERKRQCWQKCVKETAIPRRGRHSVLIFTAAELKVRRWKCFRTVENPPLRKYLGWRAGCQEEVRLTKHLGWDAHRQVWPRWDEKCYRKSKQVKRRGNVMFDSYFHFIINVVTMAAASSFGV